MIDLDITQRLGTQTLAVKFAAGPGVVSVFGPSGAGKTSLLRAIAGLSRPDRGHIRVDGATLFDSATNLSPAARRVGYVFQDARLFPHMTVRQNLHYGGSHDATRVVEMLGLGDLLHRRPRHLSGGEAQRVAIGRALMRDPRVLLLDEPMASLDPSRKAEILPYLERLRDHAAMPVVHVSHDLNEVARLATTLVVLDAGRVLRAGALSNVLTDPDMGRVLGPRGAGAVLAATIARHDPGDDMTQLALAGATLWVPGHIGDVGRKVRLRVMAHDVILSRAMPTGLSALNILPALVETVVADQGPGVDVVLRIGPDRLLARLTRRSVAALDVVPGQHVHAIIKATAVLPG